MTKDLLCNAQCLDMTDVFDELYNKSKKGFIFKELIEIIGSRNNIILAYKNLKKNNGSKAPGIDNKTLSDIGNIPMEEIEKIIKSKINYYKPKPTKKIYIPKFDGNTQAIAIPCMIDRFFQQCIKQVMEPICEAKFYNYSFGWRPDRTVNNAVARTYFLMQKNNLSYCVIPKMNNFIESVDHSILCKQLWNLGIHDKKLISIIKALLKSEIVLPNKTRVINSSGILQAGILTPLLGNITLNEFDWWIDSQWTGFQTKKNYERTRAHKSSTYIDKSNKYAELKRTSSLKEMYIVRYADEIRVFCRDYKSAIKTFNAISEWFKIRLRLDISNESSEVTNVKQKYIEFLGFKIKLKEKGKKWVVQSHVTEENIKYIKENLKDLIKELGHSSGKTFYEKLNRYNATVLGIHNFYKIATDVSIDFQKTGLEIERTIYNRLNSKFEITKTGDLTINGIIKRRYAKSKQLRFINGRPIIPIAFIKTTPPNSKTQEENRFTTEGRSLIEQRQKDVDLNILKKMMSEEIFDNRVDYHDNRISIYLAQNGKCAITGKTLTIDDIHCHHKKPRSNGGTDELSNLIIIHKDIHVLIHAKNDDVIKSKINLIKTKDELNKLNKLRRLCGLKDIESTL